MKKIVIGTVAIGTIFIVLLKVGKNELLGNEIEISRGEYITL